MKLLDFDAGVNVTVGLPFFRTASTTARRSTSPAPAGPTTRSMRAALELAGTLARPVTREALW